ncbi:oxidoreductase [Lutibacter sp.]|uniref:WD40/YVTN/BNR-like repeat-containing protein n=1 Tax=Lutibacter sp. TaxID=1925666 RepID=UPI0025BA435B|nr:oxidoreductase [Lutibacter sp.]MCF6181789.1 oxidoreductase [Lutibacter sp.]
MKRILQCLVLLFFIISCKETYKSRDNITIKITKFSIKNSSIRAIKVLNDTTLAYAGSNGFFGIMDLSGKSIYTKQIKYDTIYPEFRAIATTKKAIFILSVGNPALLYQYKNDTIKLVYKEENKKVFYDAMQFFDDKNGIAMGDPTDNCLSVIKTNDGGNSWYKIPCSKLPKVEQGEAAFAASNTNLKIVNNNVWMVTGGKKARVFHSFDKGKNWTVTTTPIIQGKNTTGIYTVDFFDENNGIIAGGDYTNKSETSINKAITNDGGKTWKPIAKNSFPNYVSCIQYVPNSNGKKVVAVSTNGIFYSANTGENWIKLSNNGFYAIKFVSKNLAWLAGDGVIAKMEINY